MVLGLLGMWLIEEINTRANIFLSKEHLRASSAWNSCCESASGRCVYMTSKRDRKTTAQIKCTRERTLSYPESPGSNEDGHLVGMFQRESLL